MPRGDLSGPAIIVDPYSSGVFFAPAFLKEGVPSVAYVSAATPPDVYARAYCPADFEQIILCSRDLAADAEKLRALKPRCLVAGCESGVELADRIAPLVVPETSNDPALAAARRHKGAMGVAVASAGLPTIAQICTSRPSEVAEWIRHSGMEGRDLVIKPPKSASTDGVTRIRGGVGWRDAFESMLGLDNRLGLVNDQLVVQEYLEGVEYVVDTMSYEGKHSICDICRYSKVDNGLYMAIYDSMEWVAPTTSEYEVLVDYSRAVLDAVGMRYGTAHVEIMLTGRGPRLIELGARPHGGGHPRFCRLATGDSQIDRLARYFAGSGEIPHRYELITNVMVVFFICRSAGIVVNAEIFDSLDRLPSHYHSVIHFQNGDRLEPTKDLFASLDLGFAVLVHEHGAQIQADYRAIRGLEDKLQFVPPVPSVVGRVQ